MKKLLSLMLVTAMLAGIFSITGFAEKELYNTKIID